MACATKKNLDARPLPKAVESCAQVTEHIRFRDKFYQGLRGRAWAKSPQANVDLELALRSPADARVEMTGPLGIRAGLLLMNDKWIELYVPRENTVFRFPSEEARRDTFRRDRFFKLLPFKVEPELLVGALLTRVGIDPDVVPDCRYEKERNAYRVRFKWGDGTDTKIVWVDPTTFIPLELMFFSHAHPSPDRMELRPDLRVVYSQMSGSGPATLPVHLEFSSATGQTLTFEWISSESWDGGGDQIFDWQPAASMTIKDF